MIWYMYRTESQLQCGGKILIFHLHSKTARERKNKYRHLGVKKNYKLLTREMVLTFQKKVYLQNTHRSSLITESLKHKHKQNGSL